MYSGGVKISFSDLDGDEDLPRAWRVSTWRIASGARSMTFRASSGTTSNRNEGPYREVSAFELGLDVMLEGLKEILKTKRSIGGTRSRT